MLGDTAALLIERYRGDLRKLRDEAGRDVDAERRLLKQCKGIGDVGVDIFFREVQGAWDEVYLFLDRRALASADALGLGADTSQLARLVNKAAFPRLATALVRASDAASRNEVLRTAA
jgi:hypothetical protein